MKSEDFCFWLQGFVEMNPNAMLTLTQWQILKDHLALVFKKETPNRFPNPTHQPITTVPSYPPRVFGPPQTPQWPLGGGFSCSQQAVDIAAAAIC